MALKYIILMLMLIPAAGAVFNSSDNSTENQSQVEQNKSIIETGIVLNASGYVQYKYQTYTRPMLQPGEYIVVYTDINSVFKGAKYDGAVFINPVFPVQVEYEEIELKAEKSSIDPTQTIVSGLAGAGAAYFMVRRKKAA